MTGMSCSLAQSCAVRMCRPISTAKLLSRISRLLPISIMSSFAMVNLNYFHHLFSSVVADHQYLPICENIPARQPRQRREPLYLAGLRGEFLRRHARGVDVAYQLSRCSADDHALDTARLVGAALSRHMSNAPSIAGNSNE